MFSISLLGFFEHWLVFIFFFNDTATTEIYTLSLHDALPICLSRPRRPAPRVSSPSREAREGEAAQPLRGRFHVNPGGRVVPGCGSVWRRSRPRASFPGR